MEVLMADRLAFQPRFDLFLALSNYLFFLGLHFSMCKIKITPSTGLK